MSLITYNGVTLPYPYSTQFNQVALYDEVGQTDHYLNRFDISVRCLVDPAYINYIIPTLNVSPAPTTAAEVMNIIRAKLTQPRMAFTFTQNGISLLPLLVGPGTVDAKNGPQPKSCQLTELDGQNYLMTWTVEANYWEGDTFIPSSPSLSTDSIAASPGNAVLFNRWTEEMEIDNCNYTTRIRNGTFRIRSDNQPNGVLADQLRTQMAIIGVPKGFLRKSAKYTIDPSGLALAYSVVDGEIFKSPPRPAFEAEGEYLESGVGRDLPRRYGEVHIKLKGSKTTLQSDLVKAAIAIANRKLRVRGAIIGNVSGVPNTTRGIGIPESTALRINLYKNEVEFSMRVFYAVDNRRIGGLSTFVDSARPAAGVDSLTYTPGSDSLAFGLTGYVPGYLNRGTAGLLLQAAAYYDPSLTDNVLQQISLPSFKGDNPLTPTGVYSTQLKDGVLPGLAGQIVEGTQETGT